MNRAATFLMAAFLLPGHDGMAPAQTTDAQVTPQFNSPRDLKAWPEAKAAIRSELNRLMGELPPPPRPLEVKTLFKENTNGFILEKFEFKNGAGATVPGYFCRPSGARGKLPCILYCHWHGGQYDNGKEELLRAQHTPAMPAAAFTARGYAVAGIDAYAFGERSGQGPGGPSERGGAEEASLSKLNLWLGRTLWGMIVRDDRLLLDYICSRPEVDSSRIGVTGISMGSTRSWWLMALDDRIKAGVGVACLTRYQNLIEHRKLAAHGIYYYVPGILRRFDMEAVVALIAPRPMLFLTGDQDDGSPADGLRIIEEKVRPLYKLYGKDADFESVIYPGVGHVYLPEMWERMLGWMDQHLGPGK